MSGYDFHPEARFDLDEIWEFIRADNLDAADRTIAEILSAIRASVPFRDTSGTSQQAQRAGVHSLRISLEDTEVLRYPPCNVCDPPR